jgi:hypothetical protein
MAAPRVSLPKRLPKFSEITSSDDAVAFSMADIWPEILSV